ncbi:MAG: type II toxin-antitoxin system HicB family antitoxin [Candidatus Sulfotelmatobacter sp.]|jgi:predicted RNase H-like HicB family nuclease
MYVEALNPVKSITLKVQVIVERDEDRFHAYCPAFKGLHVDGATQEEAFNNASEAALVYLNSLAQNKEAIPIGPYCQQSIEEHQHLMKMPAGVLMQDVELSWPSHKKYGTK